MNQKQEKDKIKKNQIKVNKSITFVKGNVFDIRQTNLPEDKYPQMLQQLRGSVPDYDEKISNLTKIANSFDINVQQSKDSMEGARGAYIETNSGQKVIELNKNNEEKQNQQAQNDQYQEEQQQQEPVQSHERQQYQEPQTQEEVIDNPARDQVINEGIDMDNPTDEEIERMRELSKDSPHGLQNSPS